MRGPYSSAPFPVESLVEGSTLHVHNDALGAVARGEGVGKRQLHHFRSRISQPLGHLLGMRPYLGRCGLGIVFTHQTDPRRMIMLGHLSGEVRNGQVQ